MMITSKYLLKKTTLLFSSFFLLVLTMQAQDANEKKAKEAALQQLLESKEYIFKAQTVTPGRGGLRPLTSEYDLRLLGDSLVSYLPFFGRAYTAPLDPRESGIQFTSTAFEYDIKGKKKGWDIRFRPTDVSGIQQMHLRVTTSGRATLQVISTNREPISFSGVITERR